MALGHLKHLTKEHKHLHFKYSNTDILNMPTRVILRQNVQAFSAKVHLNMLLFLEERDL